MTSLRQVIEQVLSTAYPVPTDSISLEKLSPWEILIDNFTTNTFDKFISEIMQKVEAAR